LIAFKLVAVLMAKKVKAGRRSTKLPRLRIFISHSDRDKSAVDKISQRLRGEGYATWDNRFQLKMGDNFQRKILEELEESNVLLIIVSKNSFRSALAQQEFATIVLQQEITNGSRRIIPIKIDEVSVPNYLASTILRFFARLRRRIGKTRRGPSTDKDGIDRQIADGCRSERG